MARSPWENRELAQLSLRNMDAHFLPGTAQEVEFLLEELGVKPGERILDLGCGAGRHSIEFARRGYAVTGLDISASMLTEARTRARQAGVTVDFRMVDLAVLNDVFSGADPVFGGAICLCESGLGVLGGAAEDMRFLRTVNGLLQPTHKLVITCFNGLRRYLRSRDGNPQFDYVSGVLHWEALVEEATILREDQRLYIPSELAMMLQLSGFTEAQVYGSSPGRFGHCELGIDDVEMLVVARRGE